MLSIVSELEISCFMGFWTGGLLFDQGFIGRTVPQLSTAVITARTQLRRPQVEP